MLDRWLVYFWFGFIFDRSGFCLEPSKAGTEFRFCPCKSCLCNADVFGFFRPEESGNLFAWNSRRRRVIGFFRAGSCYVAHEGDRHFVLPFSISSMIVFINVITRNWSPNNQDQPQSYFLREDIEFLFGNRAKLVVDNNHFIWMLAIDESFFWFVAPRKKRFQFFKFQKFLAIRLGRAGRLGRALAWALRFCRLLRELWCIFSEGRLSGFFGKA